MSLVSSYEHQNEVFRSAFVVLDSAIATNAFSAASIAVTHRGRLIALKALGRLAHGNEGAPPLSLSFGQGGDFAPEVTNETLFDLASLTKVVATTTMAAILYERGLLELDAPVIGTIPEFLVDSCDEVDPRRQSVTFHMLLAHSSGLPAYEKLYLKAHPRADLLRAALTMPLSADPGIKAEYSDIGFIVLGSALERLAAESLDTFCQREVFGPLGMTNTTFNPPANVRLKIPATADEREEEGSPLAPNRENPAASPTTPKPSRSTFRKRIIQGEVQDENAFVLGGVAPHAGLFSTADDLARFAHAMLEGGSPILRRGTLAVFTNRESMPTGTSRALGWDTPSTPSQSGKYFGPRSFGHLGYTGTSLWIDPDRQLSITLLTNRTWPDCSNQSIRQVRPQFHDAIVEALPESK
jgi:serine-type D-Ala-D-Ala carboxypeptidase